MDSLKIRNFGPITSMDLEIKGITILIGDQGSGKSCIAKLISIFRSSVLLHNPFLFKSKLKEFNIDKFLRRETEIRFITELYLVEVKHMSCRVLINEERLSKRKPILAPKLEPIILDIQQKVSDFSSSDSANPFDLEMWNDLISQLRLSISGSGLNFFLKKPVYIPSERIFLSTISQSLLGIMKAKLSLPKCILDFGEIYEKIRNQSNLKNSRFFGIQYSRINNDDYLEIDGSKMILLSQASSGIQSAFPFLMVIANYQVVGDASFILEEPEQNLFPSNQREVIFEIIRSQARNKFELLVTTHSPYILYSLEICIRNFIASQKGNPIESENQQIPTIDNTNVSAYKLFQGSCDNIYNEPLGIIDRRELDSGFSTFNDPIWDSISSKIRGFA